MKANTVKFIILSLASAVLLSLGYLFPHCGGFMLCAFVPLLWMDRLSDTEGRRHFWIWHYLTFVLWNAFTTFWVCNATVAGGIFAVLANALQMSVIWAVFRAFKRKYKGSLPYIFLAAMWIAWERFYFDAEISWPWLVLGNGFARSTAMIQWYEVTGVLGGSLWVWACNLAVFGMSVVLSDGSWKKMNTKARAAATLGCAVLFIVPPVASAIRYAGYEEVSEGSFEAVALQPNIDPYNKFEALNQKEQDAILTGMIGGVLPSDSTKAMLLLGPETFTSDVIMNDISQSATLRTLRRSMKGFPGCGILFGASAYEFFHTPQAPSYTARPYGQGRWYENYNIAVMADAAGKTETYKKSRLVIGVEKMPYPVVFHHINDWLGGVMGHCIGQEHVSLLNFKGTKLGCAICYESIYPEHVAGYVAEGAKALTVITNDAWWGDTPGYEQHLSYSCLRAIETRRDIARCANTGISAFINQRGDIVSQTPWWTRCTLAGTVNCNGCITPFVRWGDVCGRLCTFAFWLMFLAFCVRLITDRRPR